MTETVTIMVERIDGLSHKVTYITIDPGMVESEPLSLSEVVTIAIMNMRHKLHGSVLEERKKVLKLP